MSDPGRTCKPFRFTRETPDLLQISALHTYLSKFQTSEKEELLRLTERFKGNGNEFDQICHFSFSVTHVVHFKINHYRGADKHRANSLMGQWQQMNELMKLLKISLCQRLVSSRQRGQLFCMVF